MTDICMTCGEEGKEELWGRECSNGHKDSVHVVGCGVCGAEIGFIIDDDYCGPERLVCGACIAKVRKP